MRTRHDLIQATLDVISAVGLENATVVRITHHAGTSRGTLYAHFPDGRPELLAEAYQAVGRTVVKTAEGYRSHASTWIDRVCAYLQAMLDLAAQREIGLFYNISGPQMVGMRRRGIGSQTSLDAITAELQQAQTDGHVHAGLDVESIAAMLVGAIREAGIDASREPAIAPRRLTAFRQLLEALGANLA
ncbi:TetR/AcrR family transcriptional regulator [Citricoccus sp. GCM10030269]|uniref:TetR/AcrR family transcriptional regulator n=1 Tax=Citricoccus sp. GCM10030269 TaxID=3273388 RepID=UPI0036230B7D